MGNDVPEDWSLEQLGALGSLQKGRGGPKRDGVPKGMPVIRYGELYTHHHDVIREFLSFIPPERTEDYTPLEKGDVLFAGAGETADEIGKSAVFLGPEPAYGSGDMIIFRPDGRVDPLFVGYASNGRAANRHKVSVGQGSSIMHIYADDLRSLELPLPPLPEQKKIAAILSSVDDAIAATRKVIEQTKRVKKGLLQDLMTRGIGHTRFKQTEIGEIPEEWEVVRVSEIGEVITGRTPPTNEDKHWGGAIPFVTPGEISDDSPELTSTERSLTSSGVEASKTVPAGSIMMVCIGATIGKVAVPREKVAFNQQINSVVPNKGDHRFLHAAFTRLTPLMREVTGRQAVPIVNKTSFSSLPVPWPPLAEQKKIGEVLGQVEACISANALHVNQLESLKRGLMQDLLSGRVRVPVA